MTCLQHIWELILGEETIALTMYSDHWFPRAGYGEIYASDQHSQSRVSNSCKHPYIIIITQTNKSAARVTRLINPTLIAVGLQKKNSLFLGIILNLYEERTERLVFRIHVWTKDMKKCN